jgi:UDP-N-acetylglucosamine diphosphorylase/glucosamine-1-phosphate N-acetyltransferase
MTTAMSIVILAAGKGKRMNNPDIPKVMALLNDTPLLGHVLDCVRSLNPVRTVVVVGHHKEIVRAYLDDLAKRYDMVIETAVQDEQLGTGHAVQQTAEVLNNFTGDVIILSGDVPLLTHRTLEKFIASHQESHAAVSVLTARVPNADGYGRIVRDDKNQFLKIIEHKDASESERTINEINSGVYCIQSDILFSSLANINNANAQGEYYLTDIVGILQQQGYAVSAMECDDYREILGINTAEELYQASLIMKELHGGIA